MIRRIWRTAAVVCLAMAVVAAIWWPDEPRRAGGVIGGGLLMAYSGWALTGLVDALVASGGGRGGAWVLVKLFTRHAILAVAAYGMMVRLHLDPVGMLAGVTAPVLAAGVEAIRRNQRVS
ncbi:MAG: hypothetical protein IT178_13685 [Acidobacteria bacterium]|nr:hypothetical protein [Acidobacteriota bacterium]